MRAAIPMTYPTDEALFDAALAALKPDRPEDVRLMFIENTLHLGRSWVSENLIGELEDGAEAVGEPFALQFDGTGGMVLART
jgi:hypothetical protein